MVTRGPNSVRRTMGISVTRCISFSTLEGSDPPARLCAAQQGIAARRRAIRRDFWVLPPFDLPSLLGVGRAWMFGPEPVHHGHDAVDAAIGDIMLLVQLRCPIDMGLVILATPRFRSVLARAGYQLGRSAASG